MNDDNQHCILNMTSACPLSTHSCSLLQEQPWPGWVESKEISMDPSKESTFKNSAVIVAIARWRMSTASMCTSLDITMRVVLRPKLSVLYAVKSTAISTAWGLTCTCRDVQIRNAITLSRIFASKRSQHDFSHWHSDLNLFVPAQRSIVSVGPEEERSEARFWPF